MRCCPKTSNAAEQNRIARLGSNHRTAENPRPTLDLESGMLPPGVEDHLINRLIQRAVLDTVILEVIAKRPELRVTIKRETVLAESGTTRGLLAFMLKDGFFAEPRNRHNAHKELSRVDRIFPIAVPGANAMRWPKWDFSRKNPQAIWPSPA